MTRYVIRHKKSGKFFLTSTSLTLEDLVKVGIANLYKSRETVEKFIARQGTFFINNKPIPSSELECVKVVIKWEIEV